MKNKKLLTAIGAVAIAATFAFSAFAGCGTKEEHKYLDHSIDREATCTTPGSKTVKCGICGDVKTEVIPIDPNAHDYADWDIVQPTETADGHAHRVCKINEEHTEDVDLPKITADGEGYTKSEITKPATVVSEGERTFEYVDEETGATVTFVQKLPVKEVETVADAVLLGSSRADKVREERGKFTDSVKNGSYYNFSSVFYDDYTVVTDAANNYRQYFSFDDEGKIFGVQLGYNGTNEVGSPMVMNGTNIVEDCIYGFGYQSGGGNGLRTFGSAQTLAYYYELAQIAVSENKAVKYREEEPAVYGDGSVMAMFHFGYFENPFFCRYTVEFELDPNGVIRELTLTTMVIRAYMINIKGADTDFPELEFGPDGDIVFAFDDERGIYYSDDHPEVSVRELVYNDIILKTPDDPQPKNPYNSNLRYISSFDVAYNGKVIAEGETPHFPSRTSIYLDVVNILPTTADLDFDPISLFVRTKTRDIEISINSNASDTEYNLEGWFNAGDKRVFIRAAYAGTITFVLKTKGGATEKVIKAEFEKGAPSRLYAQAYTYSDADGITKYGWIDYDGSSSANAIQLYVGQSLKVRTTCALDEMAFADLDFRPEAAMSSSEYVQFTPEEFEGRNIYSLTVSQPGTHIIYLRSVKANNIFASLAVRVVEPPEIEDILTGEHKGTFANVEIGNEGKRADIKVVFEPNEDATTGKVHFYVGNDEMESHYTYTYNAETKQFELVYESGVSSEINKTFNFSLRLNEVYKVEITHSMRYGGYSETESVVLTHSVTSE